MPFFFAYNFSLIGRHYFSWKFQITRSNRDYLMKFVYRIIWAILFMVFFGFALKNTQEAVLKFFFDYEIHAPLVLLLLAFFVTGTALGILAIIPAMFRYRRDLSGAKKVIDTMKKEQEAQRLSRMQPPQPDSVINK